MTYATGVCRHCGKKLGSSALLCDLCARKAMQALPTNPKERIQIYKTLIETSENPVTRLVAEQLRQQDIELIEDQTFDPTDRMFDSRD